MKIMELIYHERMEIAVEDRYTDLITQYMIDNDISYNFVARHYLVGVGEFNTYMIRSVSNVKQIYELIQIKLGELRREDL